MKLFRDLFRTIAEFLPDPDAGLPLKPEIEQSPLEIRSQRSPKTMLSSEEVTRGLELNQ